MISEPFDYHAPATLEEAAGLLTQFGENSKLLAGGHSLIPMMKLRLASPKHLIDIAHLSGLNFVRQLDGKIEIGALTTHHQIESSELLKAKSPLLPETAAEIGDAQVRNKGTLGGSLAHADPSADWPAAILALDAEIQAHSPRGERWIQAQDFFVDLLATSLTADEILTAVRLPVDSGQTGSAYRKLHHPASGYAMVGVAARVVLNGSGLIEHVAVGITGVGAKAYRATGVELVLRGKSPSTKHLQAASAHAVDGIETNSDLYASSEYRKHLATVYARRALEAAVERAKGGSPEGLGAGMEAGG